MEVRQAYASDDFEWENCQRVAVKDLMDSNLLIMRSHAQSKYRAMLDGDGEGAAMRDGKKR